MLCQRLRTVLATQSLAAATTPAAPAQQPTSNQFAALQYRHIGPVGNRISAVHGVTGDPHIRANVTIDDGVYRSLDEGATWAHTGLDATGRVSKILVHRTGYYNNCRVLPDDPDEAMFLTAAFTRSIDGGRTGIAFQGRSRPGGDYYDLWIDPTDADRWRAGKDQGVSVSLNRGVWWLRTQLPVAQM